MKQSLLGTVLILPLLIFSCTEDHTETEDRATRWQEPTLPISNTKTPSTNISIQEGTIPPMGDRENISLTQPSPEPNCESLALMGSDANKINDTCGLTGVEYINPVTTSQSGTTPRSQ
ncbi:hypothetical protein [Oligoflexus tunisiensis]|uniref:hypothetical protein n=1 Tax=Oligoflexus tunisiensis TaxID=708132 RepID=UPI00114CC05A|nr:hypothetical protein [Oligoflexus tunisiensis]